MSVWTYRKAEQFLLRHETAFADCDLVPRIIGSVLTKGRSDNDLDIALSPLRPMVLSEGIAGLERLLTQLGIDSDYALNPAAGESQGWFANTSINGRVVEFYFPENDFPIGEND